MGLDARKPVFRFPSKRDSNQSPQLQRLARNFTCSKVTYGIFQIANNKGADQTAQAGLHQCCSQTSEDMFSRVKAHIHDIHRPLVKSVNPNINFLISQPKHVVDTQKNRLNETVLLCTQNTC